MLSVRSKSLGSVLFALLVVCGASCALNAESTNIFGYHHVWKYDANGMDLGTAWCAVDCDDSAWFSGAGMFSTPGEPLPVNTGTINTLLSTTTGAGTFITNFYFRTEFTFSGSTNDITLIFSNLIDDGAVFYLNGAEVQRVAMPDGVITHHTFATRQDDISTHGVDVFQIPPGNLIAGVNVLAVEVHQSGGFSADITFGASLSFRRAFQPTITRHPTNQTVLCAGPTVSFDVAATGNDLHYQWYSNGVVVASLTNASFSISPTRTNSHGSIFYVIVSNILGAAQSSNVLLTIFPDQCGPRVRTAESRDILGFSNDVEVFCDENIRTSGPGGARVATNYHMTVLNDPGASITVTSAVAAGARVRLTLDTALIRTNQYMLTINHVRDLGSNVIAPNTVIPIRFRVHTNLFSYGALWRFNDSELNDRLGRTWISTNYNDDPYVDFNWAESHAMFYRDVSPTFNPCAPRSSNLQAGPNTYYFRKQFLLASHWDVVRLIIGHVVDDGARFYLNGTEVLNVRMPTNSAIDYFTPASTCVPDAICASNQTEIPAGLLIGTNVMAVEVHQCAAEPFADDDNTFDMSLTMEYLVGPTLARAPQPRLNISREGNFITLSWQTNGLGTNNGYILETVDLLDTNIWREVQPSMANPYTVAVGTARRFYRLKWE